MAERKATKKRLSINLSFLTLTDPRKLTTAQKSTTPKNGVVGLGILAALDNQDPHLNGSPKISPILTKIHHGSSRNLSVELCEEYTCVISRVGDNLVNKREYFEVDFLGNNTVADNNSNKGGGTNDDDDDDDFLSSCFLCRKMLHGLDIFMYRGEKAFCSAECRCRQISSDEKKDKCRGRVRKPIEHSASPTLQFFAGVAAA